MDPSVIKRLDETVVNRIAAGEIIQRPASALKELLENSLDAKANHIRISLKNGGLKFLQIQDNGTGIRKEDLEIVCERFTTSKLTNFEDLTTIATYGFRGEALASISHIAHLSIQTKTNSEKCAYKASYKDGKLIGTLKPCAGNQGTQITIEDLFYNTPTRRQAIKSANTEYEKLLDVVSRYAVHNSNVAFTFQKAGENVALRTPGNNSIVENIRTIYGNAVAKELYHVEYKDDEWQFQMNGYLTNVNYTMKNCTFLLFINHRLVQSSALQKSIMEVYHSYIAKGSHPFIYMSLIIEPTNVDVNVHPTKHEVHFLHEEDIIAKIKSIIDKTLLGSNETRTFYTQTKLPGASDPSEESFNTSQGKASYAKDLVRTNSNEQKLDRFFGNTQETQVELSVTMDSGKKKRKSQRVDTELTNIMDMKAKITQECDLGVRDIFESLTFVGVINPKQSLIQYNTKLYLCNTPTLVEILFYQIMVFDFQNIKTITLTNPLPVKELARLALTDKVSGWTESDGCRDDLAESVKNILIQKRLIMKEYFSLDINSNGDLVKLPLLLQNHSPSLSELPLYILRLATEVDWDEEYNCLHTFMKETAAFYAKFSIANDDWKWTTEHVLYLALKNYFLPPKSVAENKTLLQIAVLSDLYKVFERC